MVSSNKRYCWLVQRSYLSMIMNDTVCVHSAQCTIAGKCHLIVKLSCAVQLGRLLNHAEVMWKATNLSQTIELTSSSCLLVLASYTAVLAQNGITIKFSYKYRVHDKLHSGLCLVQIRSLVTEIRVVLSEPEPPLPIALIGASLSEPHTRLSVTALSMCVCIYVWTNHLP